MASSDQDYHFVLEEGLQWWITNGADPSWEKLISAVESCGDVEIATTLRRQLGFKEEGIFIIQQLLLWALSTCGLILFYNDVNGLYLWIHTT